MHKLISYWVRDVGYRLGDLFATDGPGRAVERAFRRHDFRPVAMSATAAEYARTHGIRAHQLAAYGAIMTQYELPWRVPADEPRIQIGVYADGTPIYTRTDQPLTSPWLPSLQEQRQGRALREHPMDQATRDMNDVLDDMGPPPRPSNAAAEAVGVPDREPARPGGPDFGWLHVDLADRGGRWFHKPYVAPDAPHPSGNVYMAPRPNPYLAPSQHPSWTQQRGGETVDQWIARVAPERSEAPTTMLRRLHAIVGAGLPVFRQNGALSIDTPFCYQSCLELQAFVTAAGSCGYRQLVLADEPAARQIRITPGMQKDGMPSHRSITLTYERINDLHAELSHVSLPVF